MTMEKVLEVKDLRISFDTFAGKVNAIRGVSFDLYKGETLAIVGESGSGKSVTTRSIMRLLSSNANIDNGEILFKGQDIPFAFNSSFAYNAVVISRTKAERIPGTLLTALLIPTPVPQIHIPKSA